MRERGLNNAAHWRAAQRQKGKFVSKTDALEQTGDLAELIGLILGDGNISRFPRTECLRIVINSRDTALVARTAALVEKVLKKSPHVAKRRHYHAMNITVYQSHLSARLGIPSGARAKAHLTVPLWIDQDTGFIKRFLRGLYEAEGSHNVHLPTYTHKFQFSNANPYLLQMVHQLVKQLGFHPHLSPKQVQVSRREEVQNLINLIEFRSY